MKAINFILKCVKSEITDLGSIHEKFILNDLNKNQAITLGGLLRRTLLNDIGGTAITAVRISGINHEFSTLKGVREDILEILLNLKGVVLKNIDKSVKTGHLTVKGPAIVTANCIKFQKGIEIINTDHYIATIEENVTINIEFICEYGLGYKLANQGCSNFEQLLYNKNAKDFLEIDAIFMPVQKVNFEVENFLKNHSNDKIDKNKEHLILDIWTNGSASPKTVLKEAIQINFNLFSELLNNDVFDLRNQDLTFLNYTKDEIYNNISLEQLKLSLHCYNTLKELNINNVSDILKHSLEDLKKIKCLDQKYVNEILNILKNKFSITLK
jgi:DNA-directed RNA polymerase subunit alpha